MDKFRRPRILLLLGALLLLITILGISSLFNVTQSFKRAQELVKANPISELHYRSATYRRGSRCDIYVLDVKWDLRFYPNQYILITRFDNGRLTVELIFGPGKDGVTVLHNEPAWQYLATTGLVLPR